MSVSQAQSAGSPRSPTALLVLGTPHAGGSAVAHALQQCGAWVMEDPQLCRLLQVLRPHITGAICIHVSRNPLDAARLLQAEVGGELSDALSALEACTADALQASEGLPRVFVSYEELVSNPRECIKKLLRDLDALGACGLEMAGVLEHPDPDAWQGRPARDDLERVLDEKTAQVRALKSAAKRASAENNILRQRVALLDAQVMEIYASSSWRITAPLRTLSKAMQKARTALGSGARPAGSAGDLRGLARKALGKLPGWNQEGAAHPTGGAGTSLAGEDTFVLYRIIGNDLYPRHARGQAIENLRFILEHERVLQACEKRFVINRIFDPRQEAEIVALLDRSGYQYHRIPFDPEEYAKVGFDIAVLPERDFLFSGGFEALESTGRDRVLAALYRHKNNYVMNNNGARNTALRDGRGRAKWILPWDGNCFLTQEAWEQIRSDIAKAQHNRYFVVPMARLLSNQDLVDGGEVPKAVEEPQIVFRADAGEEFNPEFCYGRRPKVELLWRLGVSGPWDEYRDDPWDQERRPVSPEANQVGRAGWVARLSSGMATLETATDHAALHRGFARSGAILATLQQLDTRTAGVDSDQPTSICTAVLQQEARVKETDPVRSIVQDLLRAADEALLREQHDSDRDSVNLQQGLDDSLALALAWSFTDSKEYVEYGAKVVRRLFVDSTTRIDPQSGGAVASLHYGLDAIRMLEKAGQVPGPVRAGVQGWLQTHLDWLLTSPEGRHDRKASDHRGTCHDLQVASVASFLDEEELVYSALVRAQSRISGQFASDGRQPNELRGPAPAHDCCFNFQKWMDLSELAARWGVDLWAYRSPEGACLAQGARWLLSYMDQPWPHAQAGEFDTDRLQPIWFAARGVVEDLPGNRHTNSSPYATKPLFPRHHGIRPFWNLASYGRPSDVRRV